MKTNQLIKILHNHYKNNFNTISSDYLQAEDISRDHWVTIPYLGFVYTYIKDRIMRYGSSTLCEDVDEDNRLAYLISTGMKHTTSRIYIGGMISPCGYDFGTMFIFMLTYDWGVKSRMTYLTRYYAAFTFGISHPSDTEYEECNKEWRMAMFELMEQQAADPTLDYTQEELEVAELEDIADAADDHLTERMKRYDMLTKSKVVMCTGGANITRTSIFPSGCMLTFTTDLFCEEVWKGTRFSNQVSIKPYYKKSPIFFRLMNYELKRILKEKGITHHTSKCRDSSGNLEPVMHNIASSLGMYVNYFTLLTAYDITLAKNMGLKLVEQERDGRFYDTKMPICDKNSDDMVMLVNCFGAKGKQVPMLHDFTEFVKGVQFEAKGEADLFMRRGLEYQKQLALDGYPGDT